MRALTCRSRLLLLLVVLLGAHLPRFEAIKISVGPGRTECFTENVEIHHFTVPGGPRVDGRILVSGNSQYYVPFVAIRVLCPKNQVLWEQNHVYSEAHFNVAAPGPGAYQVCFFNPYDSRTDAIIDLVYFTLAHLRGGKGGQVVIPKGTSDTRNKEIAHQDHMEAVQRTVISMNEFVQVIMGSQRYLQRKLDRHMSIMVSSNKRTLSYATLEVFVLLSIVAVQVFTITKFLDKARVHSLSRLSV